MLRRTSSSSSGERWRGWLRWQHLGCRWLQWWQDPLRRERWYRGLVWVIGAPLWLLVMLGIAVMLEFGCGMVGGGGH